MILNFRVITPYCVFLENQADEILLSTNTGQIGILSKHAPLITSLDVGVFFFRMKSNNWNSIAIMGGFAIVKNDNIIILANEAESFDTIDLQEAKLDFENAKQKFIEATNIKQRVSANFELKRAKARYEVKISK